MSNNVYFIEKYRLNKNSGYKVAYAFQFIAWSLLVIGGLLFCANVNDFTSANLGLMISLGILVASMQIFGIGMIVHLLHSSPVKSRI